MEQRRIRMTSALNGVSLSQEDIIKQRKLESTVGKYMPDKCAYCLKPFSGNKKHICNSHSIPQFVLRNIGSDLCGINSLINMPWHKKETGLKKSGVFCMLHADCDNTVFSTYENAEIYTNDITESKKIDQICNEIALKNYLNCLYDINNALLIIDYTLEHLPEDRDHLLSRFMQDKKVEEANLKDIKDRVQRTRYLQKRAMKGKPMGDEYSIGFCHVYDRQFPIATQCRVSPDFDCWGNKINDSHNLESRIQDIHICVFPLLDKTFVMAFSRTEDTSISKTFQSIRSLDDYDLVAKALISMAIYGSQNFFFSASLPSSVTENQFLREIADDNGTIATFVGAGEEMPTSFGGTADTSLLSDYARIPNELIAL